jgi:hypothetical protein
MHKSLKYLSATLMIVAALTACGSGSSENDTGSGYNVTDILASLPIESLSTAEQASLLYMREEEKLAHDVYVRLDALWGGGTQTFGNISASETTHTEAVRQLLLRYNVPDVAASLAAGVFNNAKLQDMYTQLVSNGSVSLIEALKVGATIEEIDMVDIQAHLANVDNQDIRVVYENLLKGSRNHLRAFVKNLLKQGVVYVPQYMNATDYQAIINSETEK